MTGAYSEDGIVFSRRIHVLVARRVEQYRAISNKRKKFFLVDKKALQKAWQLVISMQKAQRAI